MRIKIDERHAGKRIWFIEPNRPGKWTLKGGFPESMMRQEPELRQMEIGGAFDSKEELLSHLDKIQFCIDRDRIIVDGDQIVRS
jgi:hypothetical protein